MRPNSTEDQGTRRPKEEDMGPDGQRTEIRAHFSLSMHSLVVWPERGSTECKWQYFDNKIHFPPFLKENFTTVGYYT